MDPFEARFTTSIDFRFLPALHATLRNALHKPWRRSLNKLVAAGMLALGLGLMFPAIGHWQAACYGLLGAAGLYLLASVPVFLFARRQARRCYGPLPAIVHVRFIEAGIEVQYPLQSVRRVSFAFVNNWWEEQGGQRIVVVLGAQFVERCGLTIHTAAVDPSTRDWLLAKLRAATAKQWTARDGGYFTP